MLWAWSCSRLSITSSGASWGTLQSACLRSTLVWDYRSSDSVRTCLQSACLPSQLAGLRLQSP